MNTTSNSTFTTSMNSTSTSMKTRTSKRSPRANSSFVTNERRETYRMKEEILEILSHCTNMMSANTIAKIGHFKGYCRPVEDDERLSHSHPYMRVLSDIVDTTSPLYDSRVKKFLIGDNVLYGFSKD